MVGPRQRQCILAASWGRFLRAVSWRGTSKFGHCAAVETAQRATRQRQRLRARRNKAKRVRQLRSEEALGGPQRAAASTPSARRVAYHWRRTAPLSSRQSSATASGSTSAGPMRGPFQTGTNQHSGRLLPSRQAAAGYRQQSHGHKCGIGSSSQHGIHHSHSAGGLGTIPGAGGR